MHFFSAMRAAHTTGLTGCGSQQKMSWTWSRPGVCRRIFEGPVNSWNSWSLFSRTQNSWDSFSMHLFVVGDFGWIWWFLFFFCVCVCVHIYRSYSKNPLNHEGHLKDTVMTQFFFFCRGSFRSQKTRWTEPGCHGNFIVCPPCKAVDSPAYLLQPWGGWWGAPCVYKGETIDLAQRKDGTPRDNPPAKDITQQ